MTDFIGGKKPEMYESPIEITSSIANEIKQEFENHVLRTVHLLEINVDREELIKALNYDRDQYNKGYDVGFENGKKEIELACKETAKEILQTLWNWKDRETPLICDLYDLADKYGVEIGSIDH